MHHTKDKGDLGVLKAQIDKQSSVSLRVEAPKNGQKLSIRLACDHRRAP